MLIFHQTQRAAPLNAKRNVLLLNHPNSDFLKKTAYPKMILSLTEKKYGVVFSVKTSHIDPKLIRVLILLIFSKIYDFFSENALLLKFEIFFIFFCLIICSGALVHKFGNRTVTFWVDIFRFSNF